MTIDNEALPVVWSIAAIDCLGAAGCSADARSIQSIDVHCAHIITAITAQNSYKFDSVEPVTLTMLEAQWQALSQQTIPKAIKIGLLINVEQVNWLVAKLEELKNSSFSPYIIYDPVSISSSGQLMCDANVLAVIKQSLLPMIDLLTPNIQEAEWFSGFSINDNRALLNAAKNIKNRFNLSILLKGGHFHAEESLDLYLGDKGLISQGFSMTSPRYSGQNQRGTGCNLSSYIAAFIALKYPIEDALVLAKACINSALSRARPIGNNKGGIMPQGWPTQLEDYPTILSVNTLNKKLMVAAFPACDSLKLGLYPVIDSLDWLQLLLNTGVQTIQLRIKNCTVAAEIESQISQAIVLAKQYDAKLFINDYWELAIKHGAYGVHLGQQDLLSADLAQIYKAGLRLGLSTHGVFEMLTAYQLASSYIALGHIFPTKTKQMPSLPQGLIKLKHYVNLLNDKLPLVAIGGINQASFPQVLATGVGSIAVVTAITEAEDPVQMTTYLNNLMAAIP